MKHLFILLVVLLLGGGVKAQEIKYPLEDKVKKEEIPSPPFEKAIWAKGHWEYKNGKYEWKNGEYIEPKEGYYWTDGSWERNTKTGMWVYNQGYWQKDVDNLKVNSGGETIFNREDNIDNSKNDKPSISIFGGTNSQK